MNFEFKPATRSAPTPPVLLDGEVAMIEARIRPDSPEGRMRESLVIDRVVGDMDASGKLINLQVMLPKPVPLATITVPKSSPLLWDVYVRNLNVDEYNGEVAYDDRAKVYRVEYVAPDDGAQTFRLTPHVCVRATKYDLVSLWIGIADPLL